MRTIKIGAIFLLLLTIAFVWALSQTTIAGEKENATAFEKRCSLCHTLLDVRLAMEKIITDMHDKAGIDIGEKALKEIEASFTLMPLKESEKPLFQEKCGECHSITFVIRAHQTKGEGDMKEIIEEMSEMEKSVISKDEVDKIHQSMYILNEIYEPDVEMEKK